MTVYRDLLDFINTPLLPMLVKADVTCNLDLFYINRLYIFYSISIYVYHWPQSQ